MPRYHSYYYSAADRRRAGNSRSLRVGRSPPVAFGDDVPVPSACTPARALPTQDPTGDKTRPVCSKFIVRAPGRIIAGGRPPPLRRRRVPVGDAPCCARRRFRVPCIRHRGLRPTVAHYVAAGPRGLPLPPTLGAGDRAGHARRATRR